MLSRRQLLTGVGATVLGFNTSSRAWAAQASGTAFSQLPPLDGVVLTDPTSLAPYATDAGSSVHETPVAVLLPGSVSDIQKMVRFCARHDIKVAARGQGHTTFGQSQVRGGLVIDMASINQIHSIEPGRANVGAGLKWSDLVSVTIPQGQKPPVLTGYLGLSIGGTLSVGGMSSNSHHGAQVDNVRELDVVTGRGELVTCSLRRHRDLFEMALAGLGQCGIITRAVLDLVPAPPLVRSYTINYSDPAAFFEDLRTLLERGELSDVYNFGLPDAAGGWIYQLTAAQPFDPASPPDDAVLFRDLTMPLSAVEAADVPALEFALRVDALIDFLKQLGLWDGVLHPWFDVFLPDRSVESYVTSVVSSLTPEDVGPTGFLLLLPQRRSKLTRPLLRVPDCEEWVYLFDILTAAPGPGPDPDFESRMIQRNRRLFEQARAVGGTRYPIGTLTFSHFDWVFQYREQWPRLAFLKRRFDPSGILTPGPGIFG
ncbi:MAG: FAD-binding protein [Myxococcota bacterium]